MIVLASNSPRRRELLATLVGDFAVEPSSVDENVPFKAPWRMVEAIAVKKCRAVAACRKDDVVIGADTIVVLNGEVLGKPADAAHAVEMLRKLSGKRHTVYTGVCVYAHGEETVWHEISHVYMYEMSDEFITGYVAGGSPLDKAGAYGVQDKGTVRDHDGEYANILGLPLARLREVLRRADEKSRIGN